VSNGAIARIAIEARLLDPASAGGVAQVVMGLASSLSALDDGGEEFVFLCYDNARDWLHPHLSGRCRLQTVPLPIRHWKHRIAESRFGPAARGLADAIRNWRPAPPDIPRSDGIVEAVGANLVHFASQRAYLTDLPSIYQPYDLQHVHLPYFFPARDRQWRDVAYPLFCERAKLIAVESSWTKNDLVRHYQLAPEKVMVVPIPPPTATYREPSREESAAVAQRVGFSEFIFYPAQTWPHKNHIRLLEALSILKERWGLVVPFVSSGRCNAFYAEIESKAKALGIADQLVFLGYVGEPEMRALYSLCTAVVIPTRFEAASLPIWEAFEAGKPVACSNVTALPAQIADAGLLFEPDDPEAIVAAIKRLWEDRTLCAELGRRGHERVRAFSWQRTAKQFRAAYRFVLGKGLSDEDRELLRAAPIV
jgi:glycosyltransferase involved in cell wall biosynthesis